MWIEPNGVVKILKDVPLADDYNNTIYFADRTAQYNYFNSKTKYTYDRITYQRVKRNYMRVEINAENLYDCNYLMFQNSSFGNRWFYAFITKVEYVANMVSSIEYELDIMQSWFYDCTLKECFIDREHSVYDNIYSNLIDEQLELGPYHNSSYYFPSDNQGVPLFNGMTIVMGATFDYDKETRTIAESDYGVNVSGGIVSGLNYYLFDMTSAGLQELNYFLIDATKDQKAEAIVTGYLMPTFFARELTGLYFSDAVTTDYAHNHDYNRVGSYTPKNKKLLSYPYKFLHMTDFHGQDADYRYEFFGNNIGQFEFRFCMGMTPEPSLICVPKNYMGNDRNYNEFFVMKCFPRVGYDIDGFKMWLAQNWGTLITAGVGSLGGAIAGMKFPSVNDVVSSGNLGSDITADRISGASYNGGAGPVMLAFGTMMQIAQHTQMPSYAKNNPTADAQWTEGLRAIGFCDMHITANYAKRIDDFFDMFGYKTNEVKVPNINSRPHWNYIKTVDCNIVGSVPADDLKGIINIFNRGITFWKNGNEVGDYSLDNRPV